MARIGDTIELSLIKQIELLASARPGTVSLAQGIPSFDTPAPIKRQVVAALEAGRVARYSAPAGLLELREEIEESLEREGMTYDFMTEIIVTAGSIEAITATFLTILDPGDEVLLLSPSYTSYVQAIRVARGRPVFVPLDEAGGWRLDVTHCRKRLTRRTRALLLCNPNNPTGTIIPKETLQALGELAHRNDLIIITDEVYKDFIFENEARATFWTLAMEPALRQRVVRVFSFSKAYAMTGWRLGFLHTDRRLAQRILSIHDNLVTCAPVISQYAALAALRLKPAELQQYLDEYDTRRQLLCAGLDALERYVSYLKPVATYFAFPRLRTEHIPTYSGSTALARDLIERVGLALVPGVAFGPEGEDHLRLSFGRSREDIVEGLKRLRQYFEVL